MNFYYKIQKFLRFPIPIFFKKLFKKYYGKDQLDQQLKEYLNYSNGFYIELGAHDGISQSNTYYYEKNKNWKGILIEPTSHIFAKCKENRSDKNLFYNYACVSFEYKDEDIKLTYSNLATFTDYLDKKFQKQHYSNPQIYRGEKMFQFIAKAKTLASILDDAEAPKNIDFLSLDTEGSEFEVLNGIDFNKYKFKFMLVETDFYPKLENFLVEKQYKFIKKYNLNDYLFSYDGTD